MKRSFLAGIFILCCFLLPAQPLNLEPLRPYVTGWEGAPGPLLGELVTKRAANARVVGLGEVSHYTRECYLLKQSMILALAEAGFGGLALEVDIGQAMIWDRYVTQGTGNLDSIVCQSGWFTYRTEEFRDLLKALHHFNQNREVKFRVFGIEMTALHHSLPWLRRWVSAHGGEGHPLVAELAKDRKQIVFERFSRDECLDLWRMFFQLESFIKDLETGAGATVVTELEQARHLTESIRQFATYVSQGEVLLQLELRDHFSARNVSWALESLGEDGRLIVWAHNGHIAREAPVASYDVLGNHLLRWWGEEYLSIGFTFHQGVCATFSPSGFREWNFYPAGSLALVG